MIVLFNDKSRRYCPVNLFGYGVAQVVSMALVAGFTWVLITQEPLQARVKLIFHIFGAVVFAFNLMMLFAVLKPEVSVLGVALPVPLNVRTHAMPQMTLQNTRTRAHPSLLLVLNSGRACAYGC